MTQTKKEDILELIPNNKLSPEQKAFEPIGLPKGVMLPTYKLLREPRDLDDIDWEKYRDAAIWRENGTYICTSMASADLVFLERRVYFNIDGVRRIATSFAVYGKTDAAIAETVTFFWSLKQAGKDTKLRVDTHSHAERYDFNFAALQPEQLAQILESNPTRHLRLMAGTWSAEQSVILATRPCPLNISLYNKRTGPRGFFSFQDEGTAFVDALEKRQAAFGSLSLHGLPVSSENLRRLFKLDVFDTLFIGAFHGKDALLPLSAKAHILSCKLRAGYIQPADFASLEIATKDLCCKIFLEDAGNWVEVLESFLNRVADTGHLEKLNISAYWRNFLAEHLKLEDIARVANAMIHAINSNPKLTLLNLSGTRWLMECPSRFENIFEALERHTRVRTFIVNDIAVDKNWLYPCLERLLSRNRNITVLDSWETRILNGSSIDNLYALNRFYNGSAALIKEKSASLRKLLVATASVESAAGNLQFTALLLSNHTDTLCEFIQDMPEDTAMPARILQVQLRG